MPFHLPYVAYPVFVAVLALVIGGRFLLTGTIDIFPAIEIALSMVITSLILRQVSPDRPVRSVLRTAATDWRRDRDGLARSSRIRPGVRIRQEVL